MAIFHGTLFSEALLCNVAVHVILPLPEEKGFLDGPPAGMRRYPVLYLLHGAYSGGTDWLSRTRIACYAQDHGLAVVMADAGNSFYMDQPQGPAYEQFFTKELPNMAEALFPLSSKREERFIAGLSMGGYGALRAAFLRPDFYAAAAALSGAFDLRADHGLLAPQHPTGAAVFGRLAEVSPEQGDLARLARRALAAGKTLPRLMISCGTEDFTLEMNRSLRDQLTAQGIALTYEEHPGAHNWDYWETHIQRVLNWFEEK